MPALRLIDVLPDFGRVERAPAMERRPVEHSERPMPDINVLLGKAAAEAEAMAVARLATEHEAQLFQLREDHAREIDAMSQQLGERAGAIVAARLDAMETTLREHMATVTARILGGVLSDELTKRSISALSESVRTTLRDREATRIEVRGPQALFESFAAALGERGPELSFVETTGFDLTVSLDGAVFETRLGEWSQALSEILS
jgi:hypothetical protein